MELVIHSVVSATADRMLRAERVTSVMMITGDSAGVLVVSLVFVARMDLLAHSVIW